MPRLIDVKHEVPQGSTLGVLLYTIFTNELPKVVHADWAEIRDEDDDDLWPRYNKSCRSCGSVWCGCYADDTTFSCTEKTCSNYLRNLQTSVIPCLTSLSATYVVMVVDPRNLPL